MRYGIDLSKDNFVNDWNLVAGDDVEFAFVKASEGITLQDSMYKQHCLGAFRVKIPAYPYHFFRPLDDGIQQAKNFLSVANGSFKRMGLDLESCPEGNADQWSMISEQARYAAIKNFLLLMPASIKITIYTTSAFFNQYLPNAKFLGEYDLWLARYNQQSGPIPSVWKSYTFWQHTEEGIVTGITGPVDMSFAADGVEL